ncbi:MAG TPA: tetratricopeptide repeat protein [Thermodesulfovibrionales bacterium]|nr:tetratricopeptide repeat protein [Thermodesulfovibrionales bacterium]
MNKLIRQYSRQPSLVLFISLIIVISIAVHFNSLFNGFVFDDTSQVLNNPWLKSPKFIPKIFTSNVWGFEGRETSYYRPMTHIIYMVTASVFGFNPWGFHLVNVLFHTGTSILLFLIGSRVLKQDISPSNSFLIFPPFVAAVLFSVHPIHTEAVAWIAGMPDLSSTFFVLGSFYLYIRASDNVSSSLNPSYLFSVALFFLAALSKEPALTLPIILVAYDRASRNVNMTFSSYVKRYALYFISVCAYFIMRSYALKGFAPIKEHLEMSHVINVFPLFTKYLQKLILPLNLSVCYVIKPIDSIFGFRAMISLLVTIVFLFLVLFSYKKNKIAFFAFCCLILPLLPSFYIPALGKSGVFAERYLYLPSFGFVMLLSLLIPYALKKKVAARIVSSVVALLIIIYSIGSIYRNNIWRNNYALWMDTIKKAPGAALPHFNLGNELLAQNRIDEAIEQYRISIYIEPEKWDAHDNLGIAYVNKGEPDRAVTEFQLAVQSNPFSPNAYNNLGTTYAKLGFFDKAIEYYKIAIALRPDDVRYQRNLAETLEKKRTSDVTSKNE